MKDGKQRMQQIKIEFGLHEISTEEFIPFLAVGIPGKGVIELRGVGHFPTEEAGEEFLEVLHETLTNTEKQSNLNRGSRPSKLLPDSEDWDA